MASRLVILDPIRFAAAAMVVLYHLTAMPTQTWSIASITKFGYLGVPLFFMISGFVIAMSATDRGAKPFALSRFLRLYPTFWAGILFTVIVTMWLSGESYTIGQVLVNMTMLSHYAGVPYVDGVYWTLLQELKFYLCILALIIVGLYPKHRLWLSVWLLVTYCYWLTGQPFLMGWFISPDYSAFFIIGIGLYLAFSGSDKTFGLAAVGAATPLALERSFVHAPQFIHNATSTDQVVAVVIVAMLELLFLAIALGKLRLSAKPSYLVIGGLTYPLYLIHNNAGKAIMQSLDVAEWAGVAISVVIVTLSSYAIYRIVDVGIVPKLKKLLI